MNDQALVSQGNAGQAGGPRFVRQFPWTAEEDRLVGKLGDREVAEQLNRTRHAVASRRRFLGRPAVGYAPQPRRTEPEPEDHYARLFASKSNAELRAILGWSTRRIRVRRRQLASGNVREMLREWTADEDCLLGTKPDRVLARQLGRSVGAIRSRRTQKHIRIMKPWRPENEKILGSRTEQQIGLLLGRSLRSVAVHRKKLGIPAKAKPRVWTAEEDALLGKLTDAEVALKLGCPVARVRRRRIWLGVESNNPNYRH